MYSPIVDSIKVVRSGKVRRAKLYYLRDRTGKSARIVEKIKKKIGIDVEVKQEEVIEENLAPVKNEENKKEEPKAEAKKEEPKAEAKKVKKENLEKKK